MWIEKRKLRWRGNSSLRDVTNIIEVHAKPFAHMGTAHITTDIIEQALTPLWKTHPKQMQRALAVWKSIFDFAQARAASRTSWCAAARVARMARMASGSYFDFNELVLTLLKGGDALPIADAWIRHVFEMLNGCPKPGGGGRHATLTKSAWQLVRLATHIGVRHG
jgi:hypothetical protein